MEVLLVITTVCKPRHSVFPSPDGTHLTSCTFLSSRFGEGEEGEHASSSWRTCQHLVLRPDRTPGHIPHVHLTGNAHTSTTKELYITVEQHSMYRHVQLWFRQFKRTKHFPFHLYHMLVCSPFLHFT